MAELGEANIGGRMVPAWLLNGNANGLDISESSEHPGCFYRKLADGTVEWLNPPMQLGVEYHTTDRYQGKPVYVKVVNFGSCPASGYKDVVYGDANIVLPIRCEGTWSYSGRSTIPFESSDADQLHIGALSNIIRVKTGGNDFSSYNCTATVYYTKTTD